MASDIIGYEFKHATYSADEQQKRDMLTVKEVVWYADGRKVPRVRCVPDYEMDFYVTKDTTIYRNHRDKKEWEDINNCNRYTCTRVNLAATMARALGRSPYGADVRQLCRSPYVYGSDVPTTSRLKYYEYLKKWPDLVSPVADVAVLDIESDMVEGTKHIISITLSFREKIYLVVFKGFLGTMQDPEERFQKMLQKYLSKYLDERKIKVEMEIVDTPVDCCVKVFKKAHEWKPDFIAIWNMIYDLTVIKDTVEAAGLRMEDLVSDPVVPPQFRHYRFIEGRKEFVAISGRKKLLMPAERWHIAEATASFYFIDAMCLYKRIRIAAGNEGSYSLDAVLQRNLKIGKLKIEEVKAEKGRWHEIMQRDFKLEYLVYNIFDCVSVELLDEKTGDICRAFSALCGISDYNRFKSNPVRIADDLHFFVMEEAGKVIGTFSETVVDANDKHLIGMNGWIVTLPSHLIDDVGIPIIMEMPGIRSSIFGHVAD